MLTRVVAKRAKTTKDKNKSVNGGRGKVQFRRKKLGGKVHAKSPKLPRRFCNRASAFCNRASAFWFWPGKKPGFS